MVGEVGGERGGLRGRCGEEYVEPRHMAEGLLRVMVGLAVGRLAEYLKAASVCRTEADSHRA